MRPLFEWGKNQTPSLFFPLSLIPTQMMSKLARGDITPRKHSTRGVKQDFFTPTGPPRGNSGGRPRGSSRANQIDETRAAVMHTPEAEERRALSYSRNAARREKEEESRLYRLDHQLGDRKKVVVIEKFVHVKRKRKLLMRGNETLDVDHILDFGLQLWLHDWIKKNANTKDQTLFIKDFIEVLDKEFGKKLSKKEMTQVVHALGFGYCRLKPGYYDAAWSDPWNVYRRSLIVPVLWYIYNHPKIVVWVFDETAMYVNHHHGSGWVDMNEANSARVPYIKVGAKGQRFNGAAFISSRFGALTDPDTGDLVGVWEEGGTNTIESVNEVFKRFGSVVSRLYPGYLHIVQTDSPKIHCALSSGSCNPNKVNLSDGGANRGYDEIFANWGMRSIYSEEFGENHPRWSLKDFRDDLWEKDVIRGQPLLLEKTLAESNCLLIFNPIAHPVLSPIELLWRDIKYDYAVNWDHKGSELTECFRRWMHDPEDPLTSDHVAGYFRTVTCYIGYFLHGGKERISEYQVKRMASNLYEDLAGGAVKKEAAMQDLYFKLPNLPRTLEAKKRVSIEVVRQELQGYLHQLNWMRLRKGIDGTDRSPDDEEEDWE